MEVKGFFLSDFVVPKRRTRDHTFSFLLRCVAWIVFFGLMCASFYLYGSKSNDTTVYQMESDLEALRITLNDISIAQERYKQDSNRESHVLKKRQVRDGVDETDIPRTMSGASFIRWGRRDCENTGPGTTLVYSGIAATAHYTHHGGGYNDLCLDVNVSYPMNEYRNGFQGTSNIYGIEYIETSLANLFDYSLIESGSFNQYSLPCSVCMAPGRITQLMIPGRHECPSRWRKEYAGFIMGPHYAHKDQHHSGEYICVDEQPQIVHGSDGSQGGERLFVAETSCPSIQCGPYVNGREIPCVICTI